jgi:hypothetical protein
VLPLGVVPGFVLDGAADELDFDAAAFLTVTVSVALSFFFFLFLAFVVTLILAVPAFLAVTTILLPETLTAATEAFADFAVNFLDALPFTFTVTLKLLEAELLPLGIVIEALLATLIDLTNFFAFLALAPTEKTDTAKSAQRITLMICLDFFIVNILSLNILCDSYMLYELIVTYNFYFVISF